MTQSIYDADTNAEHEGAASKPNTSAHTGLTDEGVTLRDEESDESSWLLLSHSADARLPRYVPVVDEDELDGNHPKTQGGDVVVRGPIEYDSKAELDLFDAVDDIDGNVPDTLPEESVRSVDPMRLPTFEATDDGGETHYSEPPNPYLLDDADERENPYVLAMERGGSSKAKASDNTSSEKPKARRGRKLWRGIFEQVWLDVEYEILHKKRPEIEESGEADQPNEADGLVEETEQVEEDVSTEEYDESEEPEQPEEDAFPQLYEEYPEEPEQPEETYGLEEYDESEEPEQPEEYDDYSEEDLLQDDYLEEENNFEDDEYVEDDAYLVDDEAEAADPESVEELTDETLDQQDESEVFEETSSGDELDVAADGEAAKKARKRIEPPVKVITIYNGAIGAADKVKEFVSVRRARIIVIATATLIILIIIYVAGIARLTGAFLPNTHIGDCDISGMTEHQAEAALTARTKSYALTVSVGDFSTTVDGASVSLDRDEARIAKEAYEKQSPLIWPIAYIFGNEPDVDQEITYDNVKFDQQLETAIDEYNKENLPADKARVSYDGTTQTYSVTGSVDGKALDKDDILIEARGSIEEMRSSVRPDPELALRDATVEDLPQYAIAVSNANTVRDASIPILVNGKQITICDPVLIRSWVSVSDEPAVVVDEDAIETWCKNTLSPLVYKDGEWGEMFLDTAKFVDGFSQRLKDGDSSPYEAITYDELNREGLSRQQAYEESPWKKKLGRYIDVDLSAQFARLFDSSGKVIWESAFVSGDMYEGRQTITGTYQLYAHLPGQVLVGLDYNNDGQPDYESYVNFWMPFYGGYGLHDATWRDSFGGDLYMYNGSHGCINLPYDKAEQLFNMTSVGDTVYVHE